MKNVSIITGGSGGIGLECAKRSKDDIVIIADINQDNLDKGKKELESLGVDVRTAICDVTNEEQIENLAKMAKELGNINSVVHTAGISSTCNNMKLVMNVDLVGTLNIIEGFLPYMASGSSMVLISSMMGYVVPPNPAYDSLMLDCKQEGFMDKILPFLQDNPSNAYNFAKRGVQLLAEKYAPAYGEKGVRINSLSPGIIETPMALEASKEHPEQMQYMQSLTPLKRNGKPEDIATVVNFLCDNSQSAFITGSDIRVDGGLIKNLLSQKH